MTIALVTGASGGIGLEIARVLAADHVHGLGVAANRKGDALAVPGAMNKMLAASIRFTPRPIVRRMVHRLQATGD